MKKSLEILMVPGCAAWRCAGSEAASMTVSSEGIRDGVIEKRFGIFGSDNVAGIPMRSLPFKIENAPEGTKTFALTLLDYDEFPVTGFCWIHWLAANINQTVVPENASADAPDFIQGVNSWGAPFLGEKALHLEAASSYGGMAPPDGQHRYLLAVYALDAELPLEDGFLFNELLNAMAGHVLAVATLSGLYPGEG